jgi:hypothetical protein
MVAMISFFLYSMHSWERRARGRVGGDVSMRVRGVAGRRDANEPWWNDESSSDA